jgi:hypothetical protein
MVRDDLADVALADRVFAPHYARATLCSAAAESEVRKLPKTEAEAVGRIGRGESIELFDISGGWAWIRTSSVVGYVPAGALSLP